VENDRVVLLAKGVEPAGYVTDLYLSPEFVVYASAIGGRAGLPERICFGGTLTTSFGRQEEAW
jgi:hypothetical protein